MVDYPFQIPTETGLFERLLLGIPAYVTADKDPQPTPALTILYDGSAARASVAQRHLSITVTGGSGEPLVVDLRNKTLDDVATEMTAYAGYTATAVGDVSASALSLLPVQNVDLFANATLTRFTSLLWRVLMPLAWTLEDVLANTQAGARQLSVVTAEGQWIDRWGAYYGDVVRLFNEEDRDYARRIIAEVTRWRLNGLAIADTIKQELGVAATVTNLHDRAWVYGRTKYGKYVGRKHARTTILLDPSGEINARFRDVVERNRAAGILPFYIFRSQGGAGNGDRQWQGKGKIISKMFLADKVYRKALTAQASSGQAVLTLDSVTNIATGNRLVLSNGATTETGTVLSVNVGLLQVTVSANLANTFPATSQVLVYPYVETSSLRWGVNSYVTKKKTEQVLVGSTVAFTLDASQLGSTDILGGVVAGSMSIADSATTAKG